MNDETQPIPVHYSRAHYAPTETMRVPTVPSPIMRRKRRWLRWPVRILIAAIVVLAGMAVLGMLVGPTTR